MLPKKPVLDACHLSLMENTTTIGIYKNLHDLAAFVEFFFFFSRIY